MRNELLHAYSLHQRPYQDKRTIYYLLTQEHGIVHGIAKKGIPQFVPLTLFATGKKSLKTLTQVNITEFTPSLLGQQQYAALYVNEITLKLLPVEDSVPEIYQQYCATMLRFQSELSIDELKFVLRRYEQVLFTELGFALDLDQDCEQHEIEPNAWYRFVADRGWVPLESLPNDADNTSRKNAHSRRSPSASVQASPLSGNDIIAMRSGINDHTLPSWTMIHRQMVDHMLDYQPLQSRVLWRQYQRYQ